MMYILSRCGELFACPTVQGLWDCNVIQTALYVRRVMSFEEFERRLNSGEFVHTDIITAWRCSEDSPDCIHLKQAIARYERALELEREMISRPFPLCQCWNPQPIPSGYKKLDALTGGLKPGEFTVIAGRPGMGKTALCWSIAENVTKNGTRACVAAFQEGFVGTDKTATVRVFNYLYPTLMPIGEALTNASLDFNGDRTCDVVFFTAVYPADRKEADELYSSLKSFAVSNGLAIVVEAAIDRELERLPSHRPDIEHIKCSEIVSKYADNILLVYREGYYDADVDDSIFEVIVAKSNSGEIGTAVLRFEVDEVQKTVLIPRVKDGA